MTSYRTMTNISGSRTTLVINDRLCTVGMHAFSHRTGVTIMLHSRKTTTA